MPWVLVEARDQGTLVSLSAICAQQLGPDTSSTILGPALNRYVLDLGHMVPWRTSHLWYAMLKFPCLQVMYGPVVFLLYWCQARRGGLAMMVFWVSWHLG